MLGYLISPVLQVENTDGKPLVGGRIVVYRHGTTEPYITYKDFEGTHNPAEVILDSKGMCILIAEEGYSYDVYCRDRNYVEQWSRIGISIGLGGTSIISRDGTITVKSAGGVVDLGISDNDVTVLTGTGAERGTDGNFSISKTAESGEGLEVTGNRVKVKKAGWYHIEATWYAQSNSTANGYRTVELSTRDSRTKLTLDLTVSSEQWRIIANDFYLHADEYIDFTLSGMGSDSAVRSWLQNVSIHRLTNIVGNPPDRVRPDWAEQDPDSPAYIFNKPQLAPVATTGSYEDLTDKPDLDIYATKVENATEGNLAALDAEGNLVDSGEAAANVVHDANYVHTDNNYTTTEKNKLYGIEAGAEVNVQADWTENDSSKDSYIQNKPNLAPVATTGNYEDLNNKPHVPTVSGDGTSISSIDGLPIYAASATRATQDGAGNNIVDTYGTKAEVSAKQDQLTAGINISISNAGKIDVKNISSSAYNQAAIALGENTLASGIDTFTHGRGTSAVSYGAHAEGQNTLADGNYAHAEGYGPTAHGNYSHAEGYNTFSNNEYSHAEGYQTSALVGRSHAEGFQTLTRGGIYAHAEGYQTSAIGTRSHAEGENTVAGGQGSHAEGYATSATGARSHAEGNATLASTNYAHAEGSGTSATGQVSHSEGRYSIAAGNYAHADGDRSSAFGVYSHALGKETYAGGQYSFAIGNYARASGDESFAMGTLTRAVDSDTHAEGVSTSAFGRGAHSEGHTTIASATYAHAEGEATSAVGNNSHSEGYQSKCYSVGTHAEGAQTVASGSYSHVEGAGTTTNASFSHAEGAGTSAMNQYSHVEGRYTISDTDAQHVEGQYNAPAVGALHVIGNGTSNDNRRNIVETYTSGVNVNGNFIASGVNIVSSVNALNRFMFDNAEGATRLIINTQDWKIFNPAYSSYSRQYDQVFAGDIQNTTVGQTQLCSIKRLDNGPVEIVEWAGNLSRSCWGGQPIMTANNRNNVSAWPSAVPASADDFTRMWSENTYMNSVDKIPSNFAEVAAANSARMIRVFQGCSRLRGDILPIITVISAMPSDQTSACFGGCINVDNYSTLSQEYPWLFANPS